MMLNILVTCAATMSFLASHTGLVLDGSVIPGATRIPWHGKRSHNPVPEPDMCCEL